MCNLDQNYNGILKASPFMLWVMVKHMHQSTISYFKSLFPVGLSDIFRHFQYLLCLYSLYLGLWGKMFLSTLYNLTWKIYLLLALVFNFHYWTKSLQRYHGSCLPNKTMMHFVIYLIYSNLYIQSPLRNQWLTRSFSLSNSLACW